MTAALYVDHRGVYATLPGVEPWGLPERDARDYAGPWPVVAHPPCGAWGRYSRATPASRARGPLRGDDGGCFAAAIVAVERWGGVVEHPADTAAWAAHGLRAPDRAGGWTQTRRGWACHVEQGHYGHAARKPTWLYVVTADGGPPPPLTWGESSPQPKAGSVARCRGVLESLSRRQRAATPPAFAALLVALATAGVDGAPAG